jgi:hypothetical protein
MADREAGSPAGDRRVGAGHRALSERPFAVPNRRGSTREIRRSVRSVGSALRKPNANAASPRTSLASGPTCSENRAAPRTKSRGKVTPPEYSTPDRNSVFSEWPLLSHRSVSGNVSNVRQEIAAGARRGDNRPNLSSVLRANEAEPNNPRNFQLQHGRAIVCLRHLRYEAYATSRKKSVA